MQVPEEALVPRVLEEHVDHIVIMGLAKQRRHGGEEGIGPHVGVHVHVVQARNIRIGEQPVGRQHLRVVVAGLLAL